MAKQGDNLTRFKAELVKRGGEVLAPTNPYELARFKTVYGVGVVYRSKRGETWNLQAIAARDHISNRSGSLAPVVTVKRKREAGRVHALFHRDGRDCFFCGLPLGDDVTLEHLVAIAHGGPNHISNMFLAHGECNQRAGHLSAPEKVRLAIASRCEAKGTE